jgi:hypothetical protein
MLSGRVAALQRLAMRGEVASAIAAPQPRATAPRASAAVEAVLRPASASTARIH